MQPLDAPELISSPYIAINNVLNSTIDEILSINDELKSIRDRTLYLEIKNEKLVNQFKSIITNLTNLNYTNAYAQSDSVEFQDVGVDCKEQIKCVNASVSVITDVVEVGVQANCEVDEIKQLPVVTDELPVINKDITDEQPVEDVVITPSNINNKSDNILPETKMDDCQSYKKEEMLFYLERYKINFLSFVQCNKNDIVGASQELIRSFSKDNSSAVLTEKKIDSKQKKVEVGKINFHEDVENKDISLAFAESDINKIGGDVRIASMSRLSKMNLLKSRMEDKKANKAVSSDSWRSEISDFVAIHDSKYPPKTTKLKSDEKTEKLPVKKSVNEVNIYDKRMKDKLLKKFHPLQTTITSSSVVKYDMSVADSPLFNIKDKTNSSKGRKKEEGQRHSHRHDDDVSHNKKVKRTHTSSSSSSKKRKIKLDKDLEEGEIV